MALHYGWRRNIGAGHSSHALRGRAGMGAAQIAHAVASDDDGSPAAKDPAAWVTGDEPMTGPQASYLDTLAQQAGETPPTGLTKAEASRAIDELQARAGR